MARTMAVLLSLLLASGTMLGRSTPAHAAVVLSGEGSSWAAPALDQWRQDVRTQGIGIDFAATGSANGRASWRNNQTDFTASDVPFRSKEDTGLNEAGRRGGGGGAEQPTYGYSYVPVTAGGTTFMYNLQIGGKQVRDLRLSPQTIVDIFTNKITNWNDPKITRDYGRQLPSLKIFPVVRSDGSGATAQFTRWMSHTYGAQWDEYCKAVNSIGCGEYTEFFPASSPMVAQSSSDTVASYIMAPTNQGTIGYDEYAFAKKANWPVVKVLNKAGYFSLPTASNVAVSLTAAKIRGVDDETAESDPNYLQQNLDGVYTMDDPRAYPISSYSYLIVPRSGFLQSLPRFNDDKGAALSRFLDYVLCEGQGEADQLGYSPIPQGLVKGGLKQSKHIPGNASKVDPDKLTGCANPTFNQAGELTLLKNAPMPSPCDKQGQPLDCTVQNGEAVKGGSGSGGAAAGGAGGSGGAAGGTGGSGGGGGTAGGTGKAGNKGGTGGGAAGGTGGAAAAGGTGDPNAPAAAADPNAAAAAPGDQPTDDAVDPQTGQAVARGRGGSAEVAANVVDVDGKPDDWMLSTLTAIELLAVVVVPPLLGRRLLRRRDSGGTS
ncbi:phosphate ABC transporter substrate-binding protein PstS [Kitasatospora sp. NPDC093558]|uniref:phosphate ABC transporter substrate-binding protein PstS n=1 Tax=Kitasatospora sp. NPDC093558 TaxID=3155201 RepID=UPI00343AF44C